jgi:hypothetical protein
LDGGGRERGRLREGKVANDQKKNTHFETSGERSTVKIIINVPKSPKSCNAMKICIRVKFCWDRSGGLIFAPIQVIFQYEYEG